jgi:uncharacterized membrane protein
MIYLLAIILFLLMSIVGGDRGAKSFFSLCLNIVALIVSIFLLNRGWNTLFILFLSSFVFCGITLFFQNGFQLKTLAAGISVVFVVILIGLVITFIVGRGHLWGYHELDLYEENAMYLSTNLNLNLRQITVCGMIWGLLGAIMDTAIAISTAVNEVAVNNPQFQAKQLFQSGMNVGKDILGTTINTLFFVGAGEAVMLVLLYQTQNYSLTEILNAKSFLQEVSMILISCIGCLIIIPVTAMLFSKLWENEKAQYYIEKVRKRHT